MHTPDSFRMSDRERLLGVIETYGFALLLAAKDGSVEGAHIPVALDRPAGVLRCHVARTNPIWQTLEDREALVVFSGPHAYISPRWCSSPGVVPTWNYVSVHVRGVARLIDRPALGALLSDLTALHEEDGAWSPDSLPDGAYDRMVDAVVGIEIPITQIMGKQKLSQNRAPKDRAQIVSALETSENPNNQAVAELMAGLE